MIVDPLPLTSPDPINMTQQQALDAAEAWWGRDATIGHVAFDPTHPVPSMKYSVGVIENNTFWHWGYGGSWEEAFYDALKNGHHPKKNE